MLLHHKYKFAWITLTEKLSKDPLLQDNDAFMEAWAEAAWDFLELAEGLNTGNSSSNFYRQGRRISDLIDTVSTVLNDKEYRKLFTRESNLRHFLNNMTEFCKLLSFELAYNVYRVRPSDIDTPRVRQYRPYC